MSIYLYRDGYYIAAVDSTKNTPCWCVCMVDLHGYAHRPGVGHLTLILGIYAVGLLCFLSDHVEAMGRENNLQWLTAATGVYGDLRDIISGVDTLVARLPIDSNKVGIFGWSYGGSMAMIAITQTNKFKAVLRSGAADWLSYYGQNRIDKWMGFTLMLHRMMIRRLTESVCYDVYRTAKTPTLGLVGRACWEAPSPQ